VARKRVGIEPQARRIRLHNEGNALRGEAAWEQSASFVHPPKQRALRNAGSCEPVPHGRDRARDRAAADRDYGANAFLIGLRSPDGDAEAFGPFLKIGEVDSSERRAARAKLRTTTAA
jgi:hypothetical protein